MADPSVEAGLREALTKISKVDPFPTGRGLSASELIVNAMIETARAALAASTPEISQPVTGERA